MSNFPTPQIGLRQFRDSSIYYTPNTPASPYDCDRYPNSPFCGGNPINRDNAVGFDYELVVDECNFGVQITPTFGYIILPTTQIIYRHSDCPVPPLPPPTREPIFGDRPSALFFNPLNTSNIWIGSNPYYLEYEDGTGRDRIPDGYNRIERFCEIISTEDFSSFVLNNGSYSTHRITAKVRREQTVNSSWLKSFASVTNSIEQSTIDNWVNRGGTIGGDAEEDDTLWTLTEIKTDTYYVNMNSFDLRFQKVSEGANFLGGELSFFRQNELPLGFDEYRYTVTPELEIRSYNPLDFPVSVKSDYEPRDIEISGSGVDSGGTFYTAKWYSVDNTILTSQYIQFGSNNAPPPPQPKRKEKEKPNMACCPQNEQLLRLILKRIGNLPATVPNNIADRTKGTRKLNSLSEFNAHIIRQIDAVAGYFPIEVEIEDSDLTQQGNQTKQVKLPNIAEALAEVIGLLLSLQVESSANLSATLRALIEIGSTKQTAIIGHDIALANADFLGYKLKQVEKEIPFAFDPTQENIDLMLQERKVKVKTYDNEDERTFKDEIYPILEMAARWNAQNFRNIGTANDRNNLLALLKNGIGASSELAKFANKLKTGNDGDNEEGENSGAADRDEFSVFLEDVEQGFISQPGVQDTANPYGYPFNERPRIRELGNTADSGEQ